jgi:hypothetical protein
VRPTLRARGGQTAIRPPLARPDQVSHRKRAARVEPVRLPARLLIEERARVALQQTRQHLGIARASARPAELPVGVIGDQRLELAYHLGVPSHLELRVDQLLADGDPELLEPGTISRWANGSYARSVSAPPRQSERASSRSRTARSGFCAASSARRSATSRSKRSASSCSGSSLSDSRARESRRGLPARCRPAPCADATRAPAGSSPPRAGRSPPELVDQAVGAQRLAGVDEQQPEQGPLLAAADRNGAALVQDLERAQDAEVHGVQGRAEANYRRARRASRRAAYHPPMAPDAGRTGECTTPAPTHVAQPGNRGDFTRRNGTGSHHGPSEPPRRRMSHSPSGPNRP